MALNSSKRDMPILIILRTRQAGLLLGLLFMLQSGICRAQSSRGFSTDPEGFSKGLRKHLIELIGKKAAEEHMASFNQVFLSEDWSSDPVQRELFITCANQLSKKRVVESAVWLEYMQLFEFWCWPAGNFEQGQSDRFFHELNREFKLGNRRELTEFIHTYHGLSASFDGITARLYDNGKHTWSYVGGAMELSPSNQSDTGLFLFTEGKLVGMMKFDSVEVVGVSGLYNPISGVFKGKGGKVEWLRAGFAPGELYAEFGEWEGNLRSEGLKMDSATLYTSYFKSKDATAEAVPILSMGFFEDRMTARSEAERALFPRFEAYDQNIQIDNFFEDVDYKGGFSIVGQRFFASGTVKNKAVFTFRLDTLAPLELRSERFIIRSDQLIAPSTEVIIRLGESDSIYHLGCEVKYDPTNKRVGVYRPDEGLSRTPFMDSYHRLVIGLDQIIWNTDETSIYLGGLNLGVGSPMVLESDQYFRPGRYSMLQGLSTTNPLVILWDIGETYGFKGISLYDMAAGLEMSLDRCTLLMMDLAVQGFVHYDMKRQRLDVLPKTEEYILDHRKERDYDVIRFTSEVPQGMNARLSLLTNDLEVAGIQSIALSDKQAVALYPQENTVLIHKNLDFDFDGRIVAGRFNFFSQKNEFKYDAFKFNMPSIDSMQFYVQSFEPNSNGEFPLVRVRNTIQDIAGELWIDYPTNKSSQLIYPDYPIFKSSAPAKIYYDKAYRGVYTRDRFYVNIAPFTIDSLDNTTTEGLAFDGQFYSAGIYPEMATDIRVQRDYSLGFTKTTGEEGWAAFSGAGTTKGTVKLSMSGLRLDGDLTFEKSSGQSSRFVLFPDSVSGKGRYTLQSVYGPPLGGGHPPAYGEDVVMLWEPYQLTWWTQSQSQPITTYEDHPVLAKGKLVYMPGKLWVDGDLSFNLAQITSKKTRLHAQWLESDQSDFKVRSAADRAWAFEMKNTSAMVDFAVNSGHFELLNGDETLDFIQNQYQAAMNAADWNITEKRIAIHKMNGTPSLMTSTNPRQEGLQYFAQRAEFYLEPSILEMYGVPSMDIADSRIFPDSGRVTIEEKAHMRPLLNAKMTASRAGDYHHLEKLNLNVNGRNAMYGSGWYQYVDELGAVFPIKMINIRVDTSNQVIAAGEVSQEDNFYLSPYFRYYGVVKMVSSEPLLSVGGKIHIVTDCPAIETDWISTRSEIDPMDIVLELPDPDTTRPSQIVYNGIYLMQDSASPYTAFVRRNNLSIAVELIRANGILFFDHESHSYVVTSRNRLSNPDVPDNYLTFDTKNCVVNGTGQLSLGSKMGRVSLGAYGTIEHDLRRNTLETKASVMMDFTFQDEVLKRMTQELGPGTGGASTDWPNPYLTEGLNRLLTPREQERFYAAAPGDKLPRELRQTIYFDEVSFTWDRDLHAFRSVGDLGIGGVGDNAVHRYVEGVLELRKRRSGDEFSLYLNPNLEHFFYYRKNVLRFYSTEKAYMDLILETDPKKRIYPAKDGVPYYSYRTTTRGNLKRFLDGLSALEEGEDEP